MHPQQETQRQSRFGPVMKGFLAVLVLVVAAAILFYQALTFGYPFATRHNGWILSRKSADAFRLSWGYGESGVIIGSYNNLYTWRFAFLIAAQDHDGLYPGLTASDSL